ncbi:glycosyltransferase family 2 protein [Dactylosporangium aurantiacum]|uniref:glycosyltransferase family 2 protein n=1 Tax=Dactylosporangium aurantiacum TaxID=35754 RepID=UPI000AD9FFB6|nr:glycosyltransferase family 2 protein [Dactylosporangium aurantiacum]MDG6100818.1 glycosyltransferase family 2 protein [Dactylosporangium aurantiacum]
MQRPVVSVVIPTRNRPELVVRAVRSALAQTLAELEVVVIIDGPDAATVAALGEIGDERVRWVERETSGGAPAARNHGVDVANAEWVAFLDDDDEWLPEKLETQLARAKASGVPLPIVGSRLYMRTPRAELIMPRRIPAPDEPISEYLAVRHGLFHGDGFIQTSTIMAPTALLRKVPFADGLRRLQELDWTLRSLQEDGVDLIYAEEPLVIWYADENRPRISFDAPWKQSLDWLRETRPRVTPRAYAALAMSVVGSMAAASRSPRVFFDLLGEARRHGKPSVTDYVTFLQVWLVPAGPRRVVRDFFLSRKRSKGKKQLQASAR